MQQADRHYDVVSMSVPISYNRWADHDHNGLIFALRKNYETLDKLSDEQAGPEDGGFSAGQPRPLVRPLVLRACAGETVEVRFWNHIRDRRVGLHLVGGGYDVRTADGAKVGSNEDSTVAYSDYDREEDCPPITYTWTCEREGVFVLHDAGNLGGTEADTNLHGLFGVLVVEPQATVWRDSSGEHAQTSAEGEVDGLYVDVYPSELSEEKAGWLAKPAKYPFGDDPHPRLDVAFREYVVVFHDEPEIVNHSDLMHVRPPWGVDVDAHTGHGTGISHVMPVSYRAEPMADRERVLWSRITGRPISVGDPLPEPLDVPVVNEEQHHSSWLFGDPDTPILRAYLGDPIRIRLVHCGVKETHVFHLHLYAWHADPNNHRSPMIDAITISPQAGHTIEPLYGAGNRQLVPGDVIWHCHLYPHFHHGMWGLFRTYDRLHVEPLTDPDRPWQKDPQRDSKQRYPDDTSIPPLLPLPDRQPPPEPQDDHDGWPRFMMETRTGTDLPADPLDRAGRAGQKSPRVPWIWDGDAPEPRDGEQASSRYGKPVPAGFDYRLATDEEKFFFQHHRPEGPADGRGGSEEPVWNTDPEPGWMAPYLAFAEGDEERVHRPVEVLREPFLYNRHGWHDPRGHRYRLVEAGNADGLSDAELRAGAQTQVPAPACGQPARPVVDPQAAAAPQQREPLYFRVHHGDPVALTLHNRIAYPIPGDAYDHALPRPGVPGLWECGLHVHMVKFDVVCADGAASGWNYMSAPRPGYRLDYRWWADEEFGVIFFHDHLFANYRQKRGLFGAMLVEPKGTLWLDPWHPQEEAVVGEQAVILFPDGTRAFRELALGGLDFVPLHGGDGLELNPPEAPTSDGDQGSMAINYRSAPLRERPGDPSAWFASTPHDPDTPLLQTHPGEPIWIRLLQGAHEEQHSFSVNGMRWRRFRDDPTSPLRAQQTFGLSEAFTFTISDGEANPLPYGPGDHLWRSAGIDDTWLGCWGIIRARDSGPLPTLADVVALHGGDRGGDAPAGRAGEEGAPAGDRAEVPGSEPRTRRFTVQVRQQEIAYRKDLIDRFGLVYRVVDTTTPDGEHIQIADPAGDELTSAPLVLRCLQGERLEVTVQNRIRPGEQLAPEPFAPAVPIDLPAHQRNVSRHVSLHADLVRPVDIRYDDGSQVGDNPDSTIPPGGERTYRWIADVDPGPVALHDLADVRNHRHHGLVGALVVEPTGSTPVKPEHRAAHAPVPAEHAWTGVQAVVQDGQGAGTEEVVLVLQDGLRYFIDDNLAVPFPDVPADPGEDGVDPEDQGQKAINYRSDPTGPSRWLTDISDAAHYDLPADRDLWVHLVGGFDKPRNHSLNMHGFSWREFPDSDLTQTGAESGLSVNSVQTLRVRTPGSHGVHAVRSGIVRYTVGQGLWATLTVTDGDRAGGGNGQARPPQPAATGGAAADDSLR